MDGVIAFYSAKDVPGKNCFINESNKHDTLLDNEMVNNNFVLNIIYH